MTDKDLLPFILIVTAIIVGVTVVGAVFFAKWAKKEKQTNQRAKETEIADMMRSRK